VVIARRQVFFVEGYDPQGAEGYYVLFARAWKRFLKVWHCEGRLGALELDAELFAHWDIEASGPNWRVATRYEFLRLEHALRERMAQPMWRQVPRAFAWVVDDLVTGTTARIFRASWRFALHLVCFQVLLALWPTCAALGGWAAAAIARHAGLAPWPAVLIGLAAAAGVFAALRPLAERLHVLQISNCWPHLAKLARGRTSSIDTPVEACAERIVAAAQAATADEIVVVAHSAGGITAPIIVARALELDPDLGRHGPRLVFLTLGSVMAGAALHPAAARLRAAVARLSIEPSLAWIDCQSRKDVLNVWDFDPVEGIGIAPDPRRCNPLVWELRFKDVVSPEYYRRLRLDLFRLHYHFLMTGDRRAPYDYLMLVAGPVPVADWPVHRERLLAQFAADATFAGDVAAAQPLK
jgi:hypothetical protein